MPYKTLHLKHITTALYGMLILALGMGLGRFLYTPLLPIMLDEKIFNFEQLSYIASANYAGYLFGSLLFSFSYLHHPNYLKWLLLISAIATAALLFTMTVTHNPYLVAFIRFLAGISSAAMMIFGSMSILQYTNHRFIIASLYAGVGVGIFLGNEYVNIGYSFSFSANTLWLGASIIAVLMLIPLFFFYPTQDKNNPLPNSSGSSPIPNMSWWQLALLYGLAGFGYIIIATYLPFIAQGLDSPSLARHLWSLVGLSIIPGCYGWIWAERQWGILNALTVNLSLQGVCVLITLFSHSPLLLSISAIGFGATFMGTTALVMPLAKRLAAPKQINLLGLVTLTYGIGQIIGPLLTNLLRSEANSMTPAIIYSALALFSAAIIAIFNK